MSKPLIVIADTNERYISTLEYKFAEAFDERIDLEIISDEQYFKDFFALPKTAEIVVVSENLYSRDLLKQNITNLFVLTEELDTGKTEELSVHCIYKYTGIKEIFNELIYRSREVLFRNQNNEKETTILSFYSAIGGTGKTSLSLGMASCLAQNHKNVLYICTESIQIFGHYLDDKTAMQNEGYRAIKDDITNSYHNLKPFIRREGFAYIPPFLATLDAVNIEEQFYEKLIQNAKSSKDFDYIIVDIEAGYNRMRANLLEISDVVLMIVLQDKESVYKTEYLIRNIDVGDREKYIFLCNKFNSKKENSYSISELNGKSPIAEYIEYMEEPIDNVDKIAQLQGIQKLTYMFI